VELIGHHASLPLVLVILYQDYRFALADLFLKRAISILALVAVAVGSYALVLPFGDRTPGLAMGSPVVLLACWVGTALLYPRLRKAVDNLVDRVILGRTDYRLLRSRTVAAMERAESPAAALDFACAQLGKALTASRVSWTESLDIDGKAGDPGEFVSLEGWAEARLRVQPADTPAFTIFLAGFENGRRLMSDDVAFLDSVALLIARRIDELRVADERVERDVRESEMQRLAAEAELRALRAQLNPHFLFNALTTIGYLIRNSPARALDALYQLTSLLRAVLRGANGDFVRLADELHIVDSYLAIEQARFEDRLRIERDIPSALRDLLIPPLILQPIIENAVKHGIAPLRGGGTVRVEARVESIVDVPQLHLRVIDSGPGVNSAELARRRALGVGLSNIERRLQRYFGTAGKLSIDSVPGRGTTVEVILPVTRHATQVPIVAGVEASKIEYATISEIEAAHS
jgi:signal transduction histidine kinase